MEELKEIFKEYTERKLTEADRKEIRMVTKKALIQIGARTDFLGFDSMCVAVELTIEKPHIQRQVCAKLYPKIAELFNLKNVARVERNMRSLIDEISDTKSFSALNKMFGATLFAIDDKPTVSELIRLLAEYYLLGLWH